MTAAPGRSRQPLVVAMGAACSQGYFIKRAIGRSSSQDDRALDVAVTDDRVLDETRGLLTRYMTGERM